MDSTATENAHEVSKKKKAAAGRRKACARRTHEVPRVSIAFPEIGKTRQSFKDECDINRIVDTYARTGMVNHIVRVAPQYGDIPEQTLFEAACVQAEIRASEEDAVLNPSPEALRGPESDDLAEPAGTLEGSEPEPVTAPQAASDDES